MCRLDRRISHTFQVLFRRLRDCLGQPCPALEDWLRRKVIPEYTELEGLLEVPVPTTILDNDSVKHWFDTVGPVDAPLCDAIKGVIRMRGFGFKASAQISDELVVRSLPTPLSVFSWDGRANQGVEFNSNCSRYCTRLRGYHASHLLSGSTRPAPR